MKEFAIAIIAFSLGCGQPGGECLPGGGCYCEHSAADVDTCAALGLVPWCCTNNGGKVAQCGQPPGCVDKPGINDPGAEGANSCCPPAVRAQSLSVNTVSKQHPATSCVLCADVTGKPDVKHLCPSSKVAWDNIVACACQTSCGALCGPDWCARIDDTHYANASDACNNCIIASCWPELSACSTY